jgi:hypothetical protein
MKRLLVSMLAAVMATASVAVAEAERRGGNNEIGRNFNDRAGEPEYQDSYWRYGYRGHWRRHYWRGDRVYVGGYRNGCYRLKVNRWGEVRYKLRRACRW